MKKVTLFLFMLILLSCNGEHKKPGFEKPKARIKEFYDCTADHQVEDAGEVQLAFVDCPAFIKQKDMLAYDAANCAWLFWEGLEPAQREEMKFIQTSFLRNGNAETIEVEFKHTAEELKQMETLYPIFEDAANILDFGNYERLYGQIIPEVAAAIDTAMYFATLDQMKEEMGQITGVQFQGFRAFEMEIAGQSRELVHMRGVLIRDRGHVNYNVVVDPAASGPNICGLSFE